MLWKNKSRAESGRLGVPGLGGVQVNREVEVDLDEETLCQQ